MFSYLSKFQRYPKVSIALDPKELTESVPNGFTSKEVIQYPFSWGANVACVYKWNGKGLIPNVRFVLLILLPIPILPVTKVGKAKPPSYSKIKLFSLIKVFPQSTEVPGKGIPSSSIKATPKFHSIKEFLLDYLEVSCALLEFMKKKSKTVTKSNFFILMYYLIEV